MTATNTDDILSMLTNETVNEISDGIVSLDAGVRSDDRELTFDATAPFLAFSDARRAYVAAVKASGISAGEVPTLVGQVVEAEAADEAVRLAPLPAGYDLRETDDTFLVVLDRSCGDNRTPFHPRINGSARPPAQASIGQALSYGMQGTKDADGMTFSLLVSAGEVSIDALEIYSVPKGLLNDYLENVSGYDGVAFLAELGTLVASFEELQVTIPWGDEFDAFYPAYAAARDEEERRKILLQRIHGLSIEAAPVSEPEPVYIQGVPRAVAGYVTFGSNSELIYGYGKTEEAALEMAQENFEDIGGHDYAGDYAEDMSTLPASPGLMAQISGTYGIFDWKTLWTDDRYQKLACTSCEYQAFHAPLVAPYAVTKPAISAPTVIKISLNGPLLTPENVIALVNQLSAIEAEVRAELPEPEMPSETPLYLYCKAINDVAQAREEEAGRRFRAQTPIEILEALMGSAKAPYEIERPSPETSILKRLWFEHRAVERAAQGEDDEFLTF